MAAQPRKLSEVMKEMAERLLRNPGDVHSTEAAHLALMFANIAWNETVGLAHPRDNYRSAWETIEADNPTLWGEFKSNDVDAMIDELVEYKQQGFPDDRRRILVCGIIDSKIHVEWLPAAAPGVDSAWEMELYGLVWAGQPEAAIQLLQRTRRLSRAAAAQQVRQVSANLGLG